MIKKCIFPVAGYGTRFLPATKAMPKEMLPIVNKPLVQYGVEEALASGLDEIGFVTGRGKRAIIDHFDVSYELEHQIAGTDKEKYLAGIREVIQKAKICSTRQPEMKGLGHAILVAELLVGYEPFGVILADDLCLVEEGDDPVMLQLLQLYRRFGKSVVAVQEVPPEEVHKFGVIEAEQLDDRLYTVSRMVEKPEPGEAPSRLAVIGRYVLTPDVFEVLRHTPPGKNGEIQITDALSTLAQRGRVLAWKFRGLRFDCGSIDGYVAATNYVYELIYKKECERP